MEKWRKNIPGGGESTRKGPEEEIGWGYSRGARGLCGWSGGGEVGRLGRCMGVTWRSLHTTVGRADVLLACCGKALEGFEQHTLARCVKNRL